jgi:RHS repeat-associated protein
MKKTFSFLRAASDVQPKLQQVIGTVATVYVGQPGRSMIFNSFAFRHLSALFLVLILGMIGAMAPVWGQSAVPSFRSASTLNGSGTLNFPAGSVSTDWLVMNVVTTTAMPTPIGWTLQKSLKWNAYTHFSYTLTRQRGTDTSVSLSLPNGGAVIAAYQNVGGIGAVGDILQSGAAANSIGLQSITKQSANSIVVGLVTDRDVAVPTPPSVFTTRSSFTSTYFGFNIADYASGSAGATGVQTWTQATVYAAVGNLVELLPLSAAPSPTVPTFRSSSGIPMIFGSGTLAFPAGSVASDWLVLSATSNNPIVTPAGWTLLQSRYWTANGVWQYSNVYSRLKGTDTSVTLGLVYGGAVIAAFQGVGAIGSVGNFVDTTASATTILVPGIVPQQANSLVLGITNDRDVSPPVSLDGYANLLNFNMTYFGVNFAGRQFGNTSATGSQTWNQTAGAQAVGMLLELRPTVSPIANASFSPSSIALGGVSNLVFTLVQPNAFPLNNANFAATLPTNLAIASTQIAGTCGATTNSPALTVGGTSLNLTVPSVAEGGCTVSVQVTSNVAGSYLVSPTGVTTTQTPNVGPAGSIASLVTTTTVQPPSISLSFLPKWIASGGVSTIQYVLGSPSGVPLQNVAFSHTFTNLTLSSTTIGGSCSGVSTSPALTNGAAALNILVANVPASGCTVSVSVTSAVLGSHANATTPATADGVAGAGNPSNLDYLTVNEGNPGFYYVLTDQLGTPRAVSKPGDNSIVWEWANSDPFGNNTPNEDPSNSNTTFAFHQRFMGQYFDIETTSHQNWFRDYLPSIGRYAQSDAIGINGGINTYLYGEANPLRLIDRNGQKSEIFPSEWPDFDAYQREWDRQYKKPDPPKPPPPRPPSPQPKSPSQWPSGWREQCIRLYEICVQRRWKGRCGECLNKCTAQQEWPFTGPNSCRPKRGALECEIPE